MAIHVDLSSVFATAKAAKGLNKTMLASFEIDFSVAGQDLTNGQVMRICTLPAGSIIKSAMVKVETAETEITDIDIGISTGDTAVNNIFNAISMATAGWLAANNLTVSNGGTYQTETNNILLTNQDANTLDAAKIEVILEVGFFADALTS